VGIWRRLVVDGDMLAAVGQLRRAGVRCCLATNQHAQRAAYMAHELGYRSIFDEAFYSCHVGHAKPAVAYFEHIVAALGVAPDAIVFIDDHPANAAAASQVGINGVHFPANAGRQALVRVLDGFGIRID
jgi:putative hydrolase of the HAD superfamily